jgi:hypothetical protein
MALAHDPLVYIPAAMPLPRDKRSDRVMKQLAEVQRAMEDGSLRTTAPLRERYAELFKEYDVPE